jgi:hypothetical protein
VPRFSRDAALIDYFALALTHGLLVVMLLRLIGREDVDVEPQEPKGEAEVELTGTKPPESTAAARRAARKRRRNA